MSGGGPRSSRGSRRASRQPPRAAPEGGARPLARKGSAIAEQTDILIIGAGLAGLGLADRLDRAQRDYRLFEARERVGGRVETWRAPGGAGFDLGPSWFWPGQPRMAALVEDLGLAAFEQFASGDFCAEDERGGVRRGQGIAPMAGALRIEGGLGALTDALAARLGPGRLTLGAPVDRLALDGEEVRAEFLKNGARGEIRGRTAILALPPRLAAARIAFSPALSREALTAMRAIPTWMAGQAKIVALYERAFWREAGLSGDAISRRGPLVEIHDATRGQGEGAALFGFVGVPAAGRGEPDALKEAAIAQLGRLFGPEALSPSEVLLRDWAGEPETATTLDLAPLAAHPRYALPPALIGLWGGRLRLGASETAPEFGGFLEGALEAAEMRFAELSAHS